MSKAIKILGTGCPNCKKTFDVVETVAKENSFDVTIEKVEDIMEIMNYNILSTPAIVVVEKVKITGRIPSKTEVLGILS